MAEFCKQCAEELGHPESDFVDPSMKQGWVLSVLCEGCGSTLVNGRGECLSPCCLKPEHNVPRERPIVYINESKVSEEFLLRYNAVKQSVGTLDIKSLERIGTEFTDTDSLLKELNSDLGFIAFYLIHEDASWTLYHFPSIYYTNNEFLDWAKRGLEVHQKGYGEWSHTIPQSYSEIESLDDIVTIPVGSQFYLCSEGTYTLHEVIKSDVV